MERESLLAALKERRDKALDQRNECLEDGSHAEAAIYGHKADAYQNAVDLAEIAEEAWRQELAHLDVRLREVASAWFEFRQSDLDALLHEYRADDTEYVTHGRHCTCGACAREDWTRITAPCGMHGSDCPAVYAPFGGSGEHVAVRCGLTGCQGLSAEDGMCPRGYGATCEALDA